MDRDDLKLLLDEYRRIDPTQAQIQRWKTAVNQSRLRSMRFRVSDLARMLAACFVGFVLGAASFSFAPRLLRTSALTEIGAEKSMEDATIEYVYTKNY